jgi:hypothetical protein
VPTPGFGLIVDDLLNHVESFVTKDKRTTQFANNRPGNRFWRGFRARNPEVKRVKTKLLPMNRASVSAQDLHPKEKNTILICSYNDWKPAIMAYPTDGQGPVVSLKVNELIKPSLV